MPTIPITPEHLVLYDGECGVCSHAVRWILDADTAGRFFFAPLDGTTATAVRARHDAWTTGVDSVLYVECQGETERIYARASAVFRICSQMDTPHLRRIAALEHLPHWLTELGYRVFAWNRRRISAALTTCPTLSPAQRQRMLP